jgi:hypothetical protein
MKTNKLLRFVLRDQLNEDGSSENAGGAQTADDGTTIGNGGDDRINRLNALANSADKEREDQFVDIVDLDKGITEKFVVDGVAGTSENDVESEQARIDAEADTARQQAEKQELEEATAAGQEVVLPTIKVHGKDVQLTAELLDKAQKIAAADVYLQQAAEAKNAARSTTAPNPSQEEDLAALARDIQMGTEEEAVRALQKLRSAGPSEEDMARKIDDRLAFKTAIAEFNREFSDIVGDPILHQLAINADDRLVKEGDGRSYAERYTAIGNDIRKWMTGKTSTIKKEPDVSVNAGKLAAKASAKQTPAVANAKATPKPEEEEKEESASDIIAQMSRQRGGPQWMANSPKG